MFILIKDIKGKPYVVKKTSIRRVYESFPKGETTISFSERHTPTITVLETVEEMFKKLEPKKVIKKCSSN